MFLFKERQNMGSYISSTCFVAIFVLSLCDDPGLQPAPFLRNLKSSFFWPNGTEHVQNASAMLELYIRPPGDQTFMDVLEVTRLLYSLVTNNDFTNCTNTVKMEIAEKITLSVSHLLEDVYIQHWNTLHQNGEEASCLLEIMDETIHQLAMIYSGRLDIQTDMVTIHSFQSDAVTFKDQRINIYAESGQTSGVFLPSAIIPKDASTVRVVVAVFEGMDRITNFSQNSSKDLEMSTELHGQVISITVEPLTNSEFTSPVVMEIESRTNASVEVISRDCVFLDRSGRKSTWRNDSCSVLSSNSTHTRCQCYHLTNFAILMQVRFVNVGKAVQLSLEVITMLGCSISILALFSTIVANVWLRLRTDRVILIINLSIALIAAQTVFLAGVDATNNRVCCRAVAAVLHYLYLAVFSLMLVEGLQLYMKLYRAFSKDTKMTQFLIVGWGAPVCIVGISIGVDPEGYGTPNSCWLSTERGTVWAFVGPVLTVVTVNLVVLVLVIRTFLSLKANARKTDRQKFQSSVKAAVVLLPLLGITWAFGIVAIDSATVAFQYLFALLNSFQGLFIFLSHVVFNEEIKTAYQKRKGRILTVNSVSHSSTNSSTTQAKRKTFVAFVTPSHI